MNGDVGTKPDYVRTFSLYLHVYDICLYYITSYQVYVYTPFFPPFAQHQQTTPLYSYTVDVRD
uniref:Uncharacterized protein n=1 Tax=Arundo donax TaxID=35708 RepID=A0A0A9AR11_ARUDO